MTAFKQIRHMPKIKLYTICIYCTLLTYANAFFTKALSSSYSIKNKNKWSEIKSSQQVYIYKKIIIIFI